MERKLVTVPVAAREIYGCTPQNMYKMIRRGVLKAHTRYGVSVVSVEDVKRLALKIEPRGGDRKFKPKKKLS